MSEATINLFDSRAQKPPFIQEFFQLVQYRHLVKQLVLRGIKSRYKRSFFGVFWTMLNPLGMAMVMTVVYSRVFKMQIPHYPVYVLAGLICWTFFAQTSLNAIGELIWGGTLLTRIYIPPTVFVATALGIGLVNITISLIPILLVMLVNGAAFTPALLFLPVAIITISMFAIGLGLLLATLAVYFIDIQDMYQIFTVMWMVLTPINYPREVIADQFNYLLVLNPMSYLVDLFRLPIHQGRLPSGSDFLVAFSSALIMLVIGWFFFTRKIDEYAYRI
jgi:lipopolysaccharide transport system permease protein